MFQMRKEIRRGKVYRTLYVGGRRAIAIPSLYYSLLLNFDNMLDESRVVSKEHKNTFLKYRGAFRGKDVVIVATGETAKKYQYMKDAVHIGVNKAFYLDYPLDFLFIQDYTGARDYMDDAAKYRKNEKEVCKKLYGQLSGSKSCIPVFEFERAGAERYFITENKFSYDLSAAKLPGFNSVAFAAFSFALWGHPKRIYLVGCDCSNVYYSGERRNDGFQDLVYSWLKAREFALKYYPDVDIFSINPVGLKGVFKEI